MSKTYKHKKLGWMAEERTDRLYRIYKYEGEWEKDINDFISPQLIENSNDRELREEKDWIDMAWEDFPKEGNSSEFRQAIEKHTPKITEEELNDISDTHLVGMTAKDVIYIDKMINSLKQKGLYLDK